MNPSNLPAPAPAVARRPAAGARGALRAKAPPNPRWDLLLVFVSGMLLTYVWRLHYLLPGPLMRLRPTVIVSLGALILYVIDADPRRRLIRLNHPVTRLVLGLLAVIVLSIPGSMWPGGSFAFVTRDLSKTVLYAFLLAASVRALVDVERLAAVLVLGGVIYSLRVITTPGTRGLGGYDPNDYSFVMVCALPLAVYFVARSRTALFRILATAGLLVILAGIVKGGSRSGFLGLLAVGAFLLVAYRALPLKWRLGAVAVCVAGLLFVASDKYWERMGSLLHPQEDYNWSGQSYAGRMEIWKRGIGYMKQRPLFGVGVGRFGMAEGRLSNMARNYEPGRGFKWSSPHNSFVEIGAELGIPGLIVFLALLLQCFRAMGRAGRGPPGRRRPSGAMPAMAQAMIAVLIGYVVVGFFLSHAHTAVFYTILALVIAMAKVSGQTGGKRLRAAARGAVARRPRPSIPLQPHHPGPTS